jgi:hypothetical protein
MIRSEVRKTTIRHVAIAFLILIAVCPMAVSQVNVLQDDECSHQETSPVFEDDRIRVMDGEGWSVCPIQGVVAGQRVPGALFRKDEFKLYLLTHNSHASPVAGGRFVEVVSVVAPWTDMEEGRCGPFLQSKTTKVTPKLSRVDLYFDSAHAGQDALESCGDPETKTVFWYGSYFVENCPRSHPDYDECGSFYITYPRVAGKHLTGKGADGSLSLALTFQTKDPDYLPSRGDKDLDEILKAATAIVRKIQYK